MAPLAVTATTIVSALGRGTAATMTALRQQRSGLTPLDLPELGPPPPWTAYIGSVPAVASHGLPDKLARFDCRNNRLADLALRTDGFAAAVEAARERYGPGRVAVIVGTSTSGILSGELAYRARDPDTGRLPAWFDYPATQDLVSLAAFVKAALHLTGPAMTLSTACASSAKSVMQGAQLIASGLCDAAVVGGADSLCAMTLMGFAALDLISPTPCRPCDAARSGISLGEAAGFALLERPQAAADPSAMLLGYGASSDGFHMSSPDPQGAGAAAAMRAALATAGVDGATIDYINLHGTGTKANDAMEDLAVCSVFGTDTPCSSTKAWTGHTLGAAGIVEAVIACLCIRHGFMPGCLGVTQVDPQFRARVLADNVDAPVRRVLSNSFGFGGINCSLLFGAAA
ncbi:MAG: beta-ketoacyl-ACP synthase [Acetobacteraceae bacterium]